MDVASQGKFIRDVACLLGVPYEMIAGGYSDNSVGKSKALQNTKTFITNMLAICRHLELLLADVYLSAYGGGHDDVKFIIRPTPRIEVNTVEEIVQLLDAGVVSFDNAMHLSNMILGIDLKHGMGVEANAGQFSRAFITPANKKDLIAAAAKKDKPVAAKKEKPTDGSKK
jgi:hypothetical protein